MLKYTQANLRLENALNVVLYNYFIQHDCIQLFQLLLHYTYVECMSEIVEAQ